MALAQGEQAQHAVVHAEFATALELAEQALAVVPDRLPGAASQRAERSGGAEGDAADQQVDPRSRRRPGRHAAAQADAELAQGFRIEQVVAPAAVQQRQVGGAGVVLAEGIQAEQRLHAGILALAHLRAHRLGGGEHRGIARLDQAAASGDIDEQFGDQPRPRLAARRCLSLVVGDQPVQLRPRTLQQQRQAFI
ncbi:hypothetical protein D3C78_720710 [compost metagenome]